MPDPGPGQRLRLTRHQPSDPDSSPFQGIPSRERTVMERGMRSARAQPPRRRASLQARIQESRHADPCRHRARRAHSPAHAVQSVRDGVPPLRADHRRDVGRRRPVRIRRGRHLGGLFARDLRGWVALLPGRGSEPRREGSRRGPGAARARSRGLPDRGIDAVLGTRRAVRPPAARRPRNHPRTASRSGSRP